MVLLAAFKALVHRYTQQDDLIVCSPFAGRNRVETEGLIGFFVNNPGSANQPGGRPSFEQLLGRVRELTLCAMAHQDLPFDRVVEELQPERTLTHLPFTRLMFTFRPGLPKPIDLPGAQLQMIDVENDLAKFEFTLGFRETDQGLVAKIGKYNRDLFEPDTISPAAWPSGDFAAEHRCHAEAAAFLNCRCSVSRT
jgi:non-ribosomal peptide synthetase component F